MWFRRILPSSAYDRLQLRAGARVKRRGGGEGEGSVPVGMRPEEERGRKGRKKGERAAGEGGSTHQTRVRGGVAGEDQSSARKQKKQAKSTHGEHSYNKREGRGGKHNGSHTNVLAHIHITSYRNWGVP